MKVILLEKLKNLGEVGEVVEVKSGYARNFLVPNRKASIATKENKVQFESKKAELIALSKKREDEANKVVEKIRNQIASIVKQAGDDGRLYGAVSSADIATEINKVTGAQVDRKTIVISTAIKFVGLYQVYVDLGEGVNTQIFVNVARSESEAEEQKNKFTAGKIKLGAAEAESPQQKQRKEEAEAA